MLNIDHGRSYATEANLIKSLENYRLADLLPIVVRNREGRWTAIFSAARCDQANVAYLTVANAGFLISN